MSNNNNNNNSSLASQLRTALHQTHHLPPPSQPWLHALISARTPPPPFPSLVMTAKTRLLASDLTSPGLLDPAQAAQASFPPPGDAVAVKEARLPADVYAQVLDVEDLSRSRWDQVEALEAVERGEFTRGREMVRLVVAEGGGEEQTQQTQQTTTTTTAPQQQQRGGGPNSNNNNSNNTTSSSKNSTHRLILQDCKGHKMYALELTRIPKIGVGTTNIGEKILLKRGTIVARGTVLLEPATCELLGGKVEAWQKAWAEGRLARLREAVVVGGAEGAG